MFTSSKPFKRPLKEALKDKINYYSGFRGCRQMGEIPSESEVLSAQAVDQCEESRCNQRERQLKPQWCCGAIFRDSTTKWIGGVVIASALGGISWGFYLSVIAGAMLFVDDYFSLSVLWHEIVVSVTIAGAAVGAVTAGALNDKLGRRKVLMISALLYSVGGAVMAAAFSQVFLVIGRTLVGLGMGKLLVARVHNYVTLY